MRTLPLSLGPEREASENIPKLTVCVIGRNERAGIELCGASLALLDGLGASYETIYVDSASTDGSAGIATRYFDRVIVLSPSPDLNASAGRHVGTSAARGDWIIYLDGDMALAPSFLPLIRQLLDGDANAGIVGHTLNRHPDGSTSLPLAGYNKHGAPARLFGGACVLPRAQVLAAGNWRPGLYSNEEADLAARLRWTDATITWYDDVMVEHFTPRISRIRMLLGMFMPWRSVLGKKFYGAGQVVAAGLRDGTLWSFIRVRPEPFGFLGLLFCAAALAIFDATPVAIAIIAVAHAGAILKGGPKAPLLYLAWLPQILLGASRYNSCFRPRIDRQWSKTSGWT